MQRRVKKEKEVTLSRRETSNVRCRENVAQEEDQSIFVSTEKHLVLFPPLPLLPRPLVCLSRLLHSPPTCLSQFLRDRSIFFFFFFFLSFSSRSRIFPQFDFSNVFLLASSIARLGKKKSGPMGRRGESQFIETAAAFPSSFSLTVAISHRTFRNEVTFIFASFGQIICRARYYTRVSRRASPRRASPCPTTLLRQKTLFFAAVVLGRSSLHQPCLPASCFAPSFLSLLYSTLIIERKRESVYRYIYHVYQLLTEKFR